MSNTISTAQTVRSPAEPVIDARNPITTEPHPGAVDTSPLLPTVSAPTAPPSAPLKIKPYAASSIFWTDGWLTEILAYAASMSGFVAIVIVLAVFNNKPVPILGHGLTLNGLIAILSTVMKATLVYTLSAAIGQLKWIWALDAKRPLSDFDIYDSASRGPYGSSKLLRKRKGIGLVSLGAYITLFAVGSETSIQQAVHLRTIQVPRPNRNATLGTTRGWSAALATIDAPYGYLNSDQKAAIYSGIYGNLSNTLITGSLPITCPSSNCTWSLVETAGICNACTNVTNHVMRDPELSHVCHDIHDLSSCGPGVATFQNGTPSTPNFQLYSTNISSKSITFSSIPGFLFSFIALNSAGDSISSLLNIETSQVTASECAIFTCQLNYTAQFSNSELRQQKISSYPGWDFVDITAIGTYWPGLSAYFTSILHGTIYGGDVEDLPSTIVNDVLTLMEFNDYDAIMSNISTALTLYLRSHSDERAYGTIWDTEIHVRVIWEWLILPAVLLVSAATFLSATIIRSWSKARDRPFLGIWKNSSASLFFHGFEPKVRLGKSPMHTMKGMEQNAEDLIVTLQDHGSGRSYLCRDQSGSKDGARKETEQKLTAIAEDFHVSVPEEEANFPRRRATIRTI